MIIQRIKRGVQISCESVSILWQHKIFALYMAVGTLLFATIQFVLSRNLFFKIHNSNGTITTTSYTAWDSNISKHLANLTLNFGNTDAYFLLVFIIVAHAIIMAFSSIYLIHRVLHMLKGEKSSFSSFMQEKASLILLWSGLVSIFHALSLYAPSSKFSDLFGQSTTMYQLTYAIAIILIYSFGLLFTLVPAIIADKKISIFDAIKLSPRIVLKSWVEYFTSAGIVLALGMGIASLIIIMSAKPLSIVSINFYVYALLFMVIVLTLTFVEIIKALIYYHFYKQKEE